MINRPDQKEQMFIAFFCINLVHKNCEPDNTEYQHHIERGKCKIKAPWLRFGYGADSFVLPEERDKLVKCFIADCIRLPADWLQ